MVDPRGEAHQFAIKTIRYWLIHAHYLALAIDHGDYGDYGASTLVSQGDGVDLSAPTILLGSCRRILAC